MIIRQPEIKITDGEVSVEARIELQRASPDIPTSLWFKFPEKYQDVVCKRGDAFAVCLYQISMSLGEDLICEGEISPRLLYGLRETQDLLLHWRPNAYKKIRVSASNLVPAPEAKLHHQKMSTFSGGVDSFFTLWEEKNRDTRENAFPLTHGIFIHGAIDIPLVYKETYQRLVEDYRLLYENLGMELVTMYTNFLLFNRVKAPYQLLYGTPLVASAMLLNPLISSLLVAGAYDYKHPNPDGANPLLIGPLCTESLDVIVTGYESNRFDKILAMADWPIIQKNLRVCTNFFRSSENLNCSHCAKCLRTRAALHVLGKLDAFPSFEHPFKFKDYLEWGRWMEPGSGWGRKVFQHALKHQKKQLPLIGLALIIGYTRHLLRRILPRPLQEFIFKFTSPGDPHKLYTQS